jgi:hypothetical protein
MPVSEYLPTEEQLPPQPTQAAHSPSSLLLENTSNLLEMLLVGWIVEPVYHNSKTSIVQRCWLFMDTHNGSCNWSVAVDLSEGNRDWGCSKLTLQMKQYVGLIVLEHLGDKFDVHVLNINLLSQESVV